MSSLFELIPSMSVVVIMAGANDIPKSSTAEVLTDLQQLCEKVHSTNLNATVVVCGILPRVQSITFTAERLRRVSSEDSTPLQLRFFFQEVKERKSRLLSENIGGRAKA